MNSALKKIHVVEILSSLDDVPMLGEALAALDFNPSSYASKETGIGTTYLLADSPEQAAEIRQAVIDGLKDWNDMFTKPLTIECQELAEEDWSQSWKRHFHTFRASDRIVVKPSWETYDAKQGDLVLALDPGMCFGTGYHGTTKRNKAHVPSLTQVAAPASFPLAHAFSATSLSSPSTTTRSASPRPTNLDKYAETVVTYVDRPGHLILSGILTEQYDGILQRYTALGCREIGRKTINEWTSGCFELK